MTSVPIVKSLIQIWKLHVAQQPVHNCQSLTRHVGQQSHCLQVLQPVISLNWYFRITLSIRLSHRPTSMHYQTPYHRAIASGRMPPPKWLGLFWGVVIATGVKKYAATDDYWSTHPILGCPAISKQSKTRTDGRNVVRAEISLTQLRTAQICHSQ